MIGIRIRELKRDDLKAASDLLYASLVGEAGVLEAGAGTLLKSLSRLFSPKTRIVLSLLKVVGKQPFEFLIAEFKGKLIGILMFMLWEDVGMIQALVVHQNYRRMGVAKALIQEAFYRMKRRGIKRAFLYVSPTNIPAIKLYQSIGFKKFESLVQMCGYTPELKGLPSTNVEIREMTTEKLEEVYRFILGSEDLTRLEFYKFSKKQLKLMIRPQWIQRLLGTGGRMFVAVKNNKVVGTIGCSWNKEVNIAHISCFHVNPKMQEVANSLVAKLTGHLKELGIAYIVGVIPPRKSHLIRALKEIGLKEDTVLEVMMVIL